MTDGARLRITDTRYGSEVFRVHTARVREGEIRTGASGEAQEEAERRAGLMRSRAATRHLHAVVMTTLGDYARQQGSLVEPDRPVSTSPTSQPRPRTASAAIVAP